MDNKKKLLLKSWTSSIHGTTSGRGSISKVEGHWPKGALLYMIKTKRFYVVHEPNENF
jgi:hypothetical protein